MNMKNTAILLIFLLCVLGLMMGVYYTESSEPSISTADYEEIIHEDSNGTITIDLVLKENNTSDLSKFFT